MISLKAFAPVLSSALGTTSAAIYERQRALIRAELLPAPIGRGRGHGLAATPESVALMLIAMMVTDNLSETDDRVRQVAEGRFNGGAKEVSGMLAGKPDFKSAVATILGPQEIPKNLLRIAVSRKELIGIFTFGWASRPETTARFGTTYSFRKSGHMSYRMYEVVASVNAPVLELIRKALHAKSKRHQSGKDRDRRTAAS